MFIVLSPDPVIGQDLVETIREYHNDATIKHFGSVCETVKGLSDAQSVRGIFVNANTDDLGDTDIFEVLNSYGAFIVLMNDLPVEIMSPVKPDRILSISFPFTSDAVHETLRQISVHRP